MHNGQLRDFEDSVLDGTIKVPHESFDKLIVLVQAELAAGAPNASWAIDGVAEGQELPANVEAALWAYFEATDTHLDSGLDECRAHLVEFGASGEDMEDDLHQRSENISNARDAAYDRGQDLYTPDGDRDLIAATYYDHPKLQNDFCDGWSDAAAQS